MIIRSKEDKDVSFPTFYLKGETLNVISLAKHLGHFITDNFSYDKDICIVRQCRKLYAQGNMLGNSKCVLLM